MGRQLKLPWTEIEPGSVVRLGPLLGFWTIERVPFEVVAWFVRGPPRGLTEPTPAALFRR
jgi:hypothetical protein